MAHLAERIPETYLVLAIAIAVASAVCAAWFVLRSNRRRILQMLQRHRTRFKDLAENIHEVFYQTSASGKEMLYVSPAYETIWGRTQQSLYDNPHSWIEAVHPEDRERVAKVWLDEALRFSFEEEYRIVRPDGSIRWIWDRVVPIRDNHGKVSRLVGIAEDITRRKEVEESLRTSEHKYRTLTDNLPVKVFLKDNSSTYVSCNEAYAQDLKIAAKEIVGRNDYEFYPKELAHKYRMDDKRIMTSGKVTDIEESYVVDGQQRAVHTIKTPVRDEHGKTTGLLGVFWDVTEQRQAEEALRLRSEQQHIINQLLSTSLKSLSLQELLDQSMGCLVDSGLMEDLLGGAILLVEDDPKVLVLKAHRGLDSKMAAQCPKVQFGHGLCGKVASTGKFIAGDQSDCGAVCCTGMPTGAHYVAPIIVHGRTQGVIALFLKPGRKCSLFEGVSVEIIAKTMAGIVNRKWIEDDLKALNETLEQRVAERSAAAEERNKELLRVNAGLDAVTQKLKQANTRLTWLVAIDPLTELLCRRGFEKALLREVQWAKRDGSPLLLLLLDLDDFKQINDTLGYPVGDVVLREVALRLKACVRATDHIARIGGDEFMILMPNTRPAEGLRVAEKVRLGLSGRPLLISTGEGVTVTASLGLVAVPAGQSSLDELLPEAYLSLRRSKQSGKNQVNYETKQGHKVRRLRSPLVEVLTALREGSGLHVVAQPICTLGNRRAIGYELLSRSTITTFENPEDFFRLSLDANMLTSVDHACFRRCVAVASHKLPKGTWRHLNLFPSTLINVPAQDLLGAFPPEANGDTYCVEISEQQIIGEPSYLKEPVEKLRRAGLMIAIDDVGFGRSSLESLILLEPQLIKIDRNYVQGISNDASRARLLKRLLRVAAVLGSEVVAEGIEVDEDLEVLRDYGVKYGQGFLLGRPASPDKLFPASALH